MLVERAHMVNGKLKLVVRWGDNNSLEVARMPGATQRWYVVCG